MPRLTRKNKWLFCFCSGLYDLMLFRSLWFDIVPVSRIWCCSGLYDLMLFRSIWFGFFPVYMIWCYKFRSIWFVIIPVSMVCCCFGLHCLLFRSLGYARHMTCLREYGAYSERCFRDGMNSSIRLMQWISEDDIYQLCR